MQIGKLDGIGWFTYQTVKHLIKNYPEHEFHLLFDRNIPIETDMASHAHVHVLSPKARHPIAYMFWMEIKVYNWLRIHQPDVFFSPDGMLSLRYKGIQVPVIHDLNFEHRPQDLRWFDRIYYKTFFPRFTKTAHCVLTVSEFSKQDVIKTYNIQPSKIHVVYNGVNEGYQPITESIKIEIQKKYSASQPYFIYVGSLHPRKNIQGLINGYYAYLKAGGTHNILLCGARFWKTGTLDQLILKLGLTSKITFTGLQSTTQLNLLVAAAEALCLVSFFEGFGIPIIEAMASGVPVMCSNCTAMPEISGDAAFWIDPEDPKTIGNALIQLETSKELKNRLIQKGLIRAKSFSWNETALRIGNILNL